MSEHLVTAPRTDTRARAQKVALELFAEQGYEKTSLREIAERLGITKAALYYHFKSKEDIVRSFTEDHFDRIDALIQWGQTRPRTDQTRRELLERYVELVLLGQEVFLFLERNRAAMDSMQQGKERMNQFRERLDRLVDVIAGPDASVRERARAAAAIFAVGATCMFSASSIDPPELRSIVLEIADDLTSPSRHAQSPR